MKSTLSVLKNLAVGKASLKSRRKLSSLVLENLEGRDLLSNMPCIGPMPVHPPAPSCHQNPAPAPAPKPAPGPACHQNPAPAPDCHNNPPPPAPGPDCHRNPPPPPPAPGCGVLAGTVFNDTNKSGSLDGCDSYLSGAVVSLYKDGSCSPIATQVTGANGQYTFTGLAVGNYKIVECPPLFYSAETTYIRSGLNPASGACANVINATVVDPSSVYANNGGNNTSEYTVVGVLFNGTPELTSAGPLLSSLGTTAGANNLNCGFSTLCADMFTSMSFQGGESYQVKPQLISQINNGSGVISADHAGRIAYLFNHYANSNLSSTQGAALQLAVWELLYDSGSTPDFTHGNFAIDPNANSYTDQATLNTVIGQATAFFNDSCGKSETALVLNADCYNSGGNGYQNVLATCSLDFANTSWFSCHNACASTPVNNGGFGQGDCVSWLPTIVDCISTLTNRSSGLGCFSLFAA